MANQDRMAFLMSISEITPQVFLSGQVAATIEQVQKLGITYIVNVALESTVIPYPKSVRVEKYDILDFPTAPIGHYFDALTDSIHAHLQARKQNKVLVHCMAGISRSTTIVCAYLMRCMNMSLREAYLQCKVNRPICFPNLGFWNQLIAYEQQLTKQNTVKMILTQFGHLPDVAFEEIRQLRAQASNSRLAYESPARSTVRDASSNHHHTGPVRSRSLAVHSTVRPPSTTTNKPSYRIAINRSIPDADPPVHQRRVPLDASSTVKLQPGYPTRSSLLSTDSSNNHEQQPRQSNYQTTYRSSFVKPTIPWNENTF